MIVVLAPSGLRTTGPFMVSFARNPEHLRESRARDNKKTMPDFVCQADPTQICICVPSALALAAKQEFSLLSCDRRDT
jgi:hypothetical protein